MSALRDGTRRPPGRKHTLVVGGRDATAALERAGHVVAPTVDVALEELATERFDRLLIDGSGPRGDERLEGADRLREASSASPVVAFCADDDDARAAVDAGANVVVRAALRSLSAEALEDELAAILGRRGADAGRHEAVADLGRRALEGTPSSALLERAVTLVRDALSLERCGAFELVPEGRLLLREGVGWGPDAVDTLTLDAEGSQAARSLTGEPAVGVLDEFEGDGMLADGPGSGISVVVGSGEEPWGVLGAYASDRRTFDASDVGFVRSVANVLGGVVARERTDRRTRIDGDLAERITETSPIGITVVGRDGRITFANERAEVIFGRSRAEMNALAYDDEEWEETDFAGEPLPPEELPFRRVMEAGEPISDHQSRVRRPDGSYAWLSINGVPLYEEGEIAGVVFAIGDVTERHRFEVELEEVYGRVTDAFVALDANARVTHLNERAERLLGLPAERLIGTEIWEPFPDVFEETFREDYWEAMETQEPIERERYYPFLDRWYEGRAYPSESGLSVYFRDVTERKEHERELELFHTLVDHSTDAIYVNDPETGEFLDVNETATRHLGYAREELLGMTVPDVDRTVPDRQAWQSLVEEIRAAGRLTVDSTHRRKDGSTFPAEINASYVESEDGQEYVVAVGRDVTERKAHERMLREERDLIERIVETSPVGIVTLDADGTFEMVNRRAEEILGHPRDDLEAFAGSTDDFDPVGSDGDPLSLEEIPTRRVLTKTETFHDVELGLRPPGGERVWLSVSGTPLRDEGGEPTGGVITFADVTDRREHERELERYKRYTDDVLDAIDDVFYVLDDEGRLRRWNATGTEVTGYTDEEGASMDALDFFHEDEHAAVANAIATGFETGHARVEADLVTTEGDSIPYEFDASALETPEGEPALVGIGRDVTERRAATVELRRRIDQQAAVARLGRLALETDDLDALFQEASALVAGVLDTPYSKVLELDADGRECLIRRGVGWRDGIVGEVSVPVVEDTQAGYTLLTEKPILTEDLASETRFTGHDVLSSHGVVSGITVVVGTVEDPWGVLGVHDTERREFTEYDTDFVRSVANVLANAIDRVEHERELERYETIVETVNDGIYVVDATGRFTMVNETYASMLGYDRDELVGAHASVVVDDEVIESAREIGESMRAGETEPPSLEATLRAADGQRFEAEATFALLPDADGNGERVGVVRDITDRKRIERQLRLSAETLHGLYELTTSGELPFEEKLGRVLEAGCERLGLEYGIFTRIEDDTMTIVQSHADHELYEPGVSCPLSRSYCRRVLEQEGLVVVDDALEEGWAGDPAYETFELGTYAGGQVVVGGEVYGTICFTSSDPRGEPLSEIERTFVELVNGWASYELERTENQNELERQREQLASLDQLNAVIREISHGILESASCEEIETAVCERLADRYRFAWIGGVGRGTNDVTPTAAAGVGEDYLDEIDISLDPDEPNGCGPTAEAIRSREPQFRTNVLEDPSYEPWYEAARERGYRSSAAIPIQHEGSIYGVLNVYSACPDAFADAERDVLTHLGEIVGHTIYAVEQRKALISDATLELELRIDDGDHPLIEAVSSSSAEIDLRRTVPTAGGSMLQFLTVSGMSASAFRSAAERIESVERVTLLTEADDELTFELKLSESPLIDALAGFGGRLTTAMIRTGELRILVELPPSADVRAVVAAVGEHYADAELLAQRTKTRDETSRRELHDVLADRLTDKQRAALEASYFAGYFDWPRGHTGEEIAELLGLSPATLSQHLRIAERKLFDTLFAEA